MSIALLFKISVAIFSFGLFLNGLMKFLSGRRNQTVFKFLANSTVWLAISLSSLFPSHVRIISQKLGFGESLNTFIFIGFIIVFVILFKLISIIERTERNISEIVRKEALSKISQKQ